MKLKAYRTQNMHEEKSSLQHTRGILMFNPKPYSTATAETRWQQQQRTVMAQGRPWDRIREREGSPHSYRCLIIFTNCQDIYCGNDELENRSRWENWISMCEKNKVRSISAQNQ